jgi:putative addiction module component (TIGR02574 family)
MEASVRTVLEAALRLPVNERLEIASQLLDTVTPDDDVLQLDDQSLVEELDRRFADREGSIGWDELRREECSM